jgi:hypothetical protein
MTRDAAITKRRKQLVKEAFLLLKAISDLAESCAEDPLTDATTLARAVTCGLLDASQLSNNKFGRGQIRTRIFNHLRMRKLSVQTERFLEQFCEQLQPRCLPRPQP